MAGATMKTIGGAPQAEDLQAEITRLRAENARLTAAKPTATLTIKVSGPQRDKTGTVIGPSRGAVSVYGLGRFPVTLYRKQWRRLLAIGQDLEAFMQEHASELQDKE